MKVCHSIQELLDEELSQMWEGLDYGGVECGSYERVVCRDRYFYPDPRET